MEIMIKKVVFKIFQEMNLKFSHCVLKVKQLNCDAAGTISTLLRFLGTFGRGVNSGLNGSSGVGTGFGIGIEVGDGVKSGNPTTGAFVETIGGGFVGGVPGAVDCVTTGGRVDGVTLGGGGFVGAVFPGTVVVPIGELGELGGVNSGSELDVVGTGTVVVDTGTVVVGTIVLHCCATKLSGNVSQFSHTKH